MSVTKKLRSVLINFCFVIICNAQTDYFNSANWRDTDDLDPHSFYYDKHTKKETWPPGDNDSHEIGEYNGGDASACCKQLHKCKAAQNTDVSDELLSRRIVNIILSRGQFKKDGSYFNGRIELEATLSELEALKNFGLGKLTLREVDPILNKVIQAPAFDIVHETVLWVQTASTFLWNLLLQIWNLVLQHKEYTFAALALLFTYGLLKRTRLNSWILLVVSLKLIFVASFIITYLQLIQEAKIKHTAAQMKNLQTPVQCDPEKMSWLDRIKSFIYNDACEEYYRAVMSEPMYEVTPAQALTHMLANSMFEPIAVSGKMISAFLKNITGHMPWLLSWIIQCAFFLGFIPGSILFIILLLGGTLNLGFGPFSLFSLRGPQNERLESKKTRQPIEVMLNVLGAMLDYISINTVTANVQLPPSIEDASGRSNNLAIAPYSDSCGRDKQKKAGSVEELTYHDKASGDCETTNGLGISRDEPGIEVGVEKREVVEKGSGDHSG